MNRRHVDLGSPSTRDGRAQRLNRLALNRGAISIASIFVLVVAAALFLPSLAGDDGAPASPVATLTASPEPTMVAVTGAVPVQVARIIDGDTLDVLTSEGEMRVRLFGVDTPERGEACYQEATDRLAELAGQTVQLLPDQRLEDPNGRALRYLYAFDGTFIDEALVREGYGVAWRRDGALREQIIAAEEAARIGGVGCLWGE